MKDAFDIVADLTSLINIEDITNELTGDIWPDDRPDNSQNSDIVVNSIGITNNAMQLGYGNVNIYSPIVTRNVNGKDVQVSDKIELKRLVKLVTPYLENQYRDTFYTEVEDPGTLLQDADGSWFANIRVKYYSIQENYQNI